MFVSNNYFLSYYKIKDVDVVIAKYLLKIIFGNFNTEVKFHKTINDDENPLIKFRIDLSRCDNILFRSLNHMSNKFKKLCSSLKHSKNTFLVPYYKLYYMPSEMKPIYFMHDCFTDKKFALSLLSQLCNDQSSLTSKTTLVYFSYTISTFQNHVVKPGE